MLVVDMTIYDNLVIIKRDIIFVWIELKKFKIKDGLTDDKSYKFIRSYHIYSCNKRF